MGGELIVGIVLLVVGIGGLVVGQILMRSKGEATWLTAFNLGSAVLIAAGVILILLGIIG